MSQEPQETKQEHSCGSVLSEIMAGVASITQDQIEATEPEDELEEGDKVLGTASEEVMRLFAHRGLLIRDLKISMANLEVTRGSQKKEMVAKIKRLTKMIENLSSLLWCQVYDDLDVWRRNEGCNRVGLREGWQVVSFSESPSGLREIFDHLTAVIVGATDDGAEERVAEEPSIDSTSAEQAEDHAQEEIPTGQ